ncbi:MAG: hypothetical protein POG74_02715 [Acidocella sp.]|nr:hypothetical protein [Acidocella sp.]
MPAFAKQNLPRVAILAGALAAAIALAVLYYWLFSTEQINSDQANALLAGQDMLAGNWRLHDWWMAPDNYIGLEELVFAAVWGLTHNTILTIRLVAIFAWVCLGIVSFFLATSEHSRQGRFRGLVILGAIILIPASGNGISDFYFNAPLHVLTVTCIMLAILIIDHAIKAAHQLPVMMAILACIAVDAAASDSMFIYIGIFPIVTALLFMPQNKVPRRDKIILVLVASTGLAILLLHLNGWAGGFTPHSLSVVLSPLRRLPPNIEHMYLCLLYILGCESLGQNTIGTIVAIIRFPLLGLAALPIYLIVKHQIFGIRQSNSNLVSRSFIDISLCLVALADIGSTCVSNILEDIQGIRFFLPAWVAVSILASRYFLQNQKIVYYSGIIAICAVVSDLTFLARHPHPSAFPPAINALTSALEQHHLEYGYALYWQASVSAAASDGKLHVSAVVPNQTGGIAPYQWFSKTDWYKGQAAKQFFVIVSNEPKIIDEQMVFTQFGRPVSSFTVENMTIYIFQGALPALTWNSPAGAL